MLKAFAVVLLVVFAVGGTCASTGIGFHNTEVELRSQYEAKTDANKADFDAMWKTIQQVAQVPNQAKEAFKDIFTSYAEARSGGGNDGGTLMKWVQEAVPGGTFDMSLFAKVQTVVEAQRATFSNRQKELRDIKREHDKLLRSFPNNIINMLLGRQELEVVLVTSAKTDEAFQTGEENDIDLFPTKK